MIAWVGIDPGASGAMALLADDGTLEICDFQDASERQIIASARWWAEEYVVRHWVLEQVGSMPKQGVKSMFSLGREYGWVQGWLTALGLPWSLVRPQLWQRGAIPPRPKGCKKRSTLVAERRWPNVKFRGPAGGWRSGRADAALMAEYAKRSGL